MKSQERLWCQGWKSPFKVRRKEGTGTSYKPPALPTVADTLFGTSGLQRLRWPACQRASAQLAWSCGQGCGEGWIKQNWAVCDWPKLRSCAPASRSGRLWGNKFTEQYLERMNRSGEADLWRSTSKVEATITNRYPLRCATLEEETRLA